MKHFLQNTVNSENFAWENKILSKIFKVTISSFIFPWIMSQDLPSAAVPNGLYYIRVNLLEYRCHNTVNVLKFQTQISISLIQTEPEFVLQIVGNSIIEMIDSFLACGRNFYRLRITFAYSLDPVQDQKNAAIVWIQNVKHSERIIWKSWFWKARRRQ